MKREDTKCARQCTFRSSQQPALRNTLVYKCTSACGKHIIFTHQVECSFNSIGSSECLSHVFYYVIVRCLIPVVLPDRFMALSVDDCEQQGAISVPWWNGANTSFYARTHRSLICVQTHPCSSRSWHRDTPESLLRTDPVTVWSHLLALTWFK